jgi:hypothetical protein
MNCLPFTAWAGKILFMERVMKPFPPKIHCSLEYLSLSRYRRLIFGEEDRDGSRYKKKGKVGTRWKGKEVENEGKTSGNEKE